ncbi:putative RNA-binding Zn ribbon-like protein [Catenuloplanes nepalensis]|uniref:RNA-binding Zn ribbon-like protein n=1 Tax=Catenuloplanes nepalensis TaxID=587533 RepID=A0ABT9MWQ0_9ACTN|nr:ABATE domain-containing protein [Catenuloplanes nepalensis]MDP9795862.1 putative RNA-binding Zn ribbon-like protein [Catenuloplanes nepalensis]
MEFVFVSGNLALDLLGTLKWRRTEPQEGLRTPGDAARWAVEAGLVTARPKLTATDVESLRALRESIYRLVMAMWDRTPMPRADQVALNTAAAGPRVLTTLVGLDARRTATAAALEAEVAAAAIRLIADVNAGRGPRMQECERQDCTRLFLDRSRGRTRTWCGMGECGNRVKAAGYRARKAAVQGS